MRNGEYELVIAPDKFPGLKYRGRYCYEHTLVYWQNTGIIPGPGECIHHKNDKKRDNRFANLEIKSRVEHTVKHNRERGRKFVRLLCPSCHKIFERERRQTHLANGLDFTYCSRKCSGRGPIGITQNVIEEFRKYS